LEHGQSEGKKTKKVNQNLSRTARDDSDHYNTGEEISNYGESTRKKRSGTIDFRVALTMEYCPSWVLKRHGGGRHTSNRKERRKKRGRPDF